MHVQQERLPDSYVLTYVILLKSKSERPRTTCPGLL